MELQCYTLSFHIVCMDTSKLCFHALKTVDSGKNGGVYVLHVNYLLPPYSTLFCAFGPDSSLLAVAVVLKRSGR